MAKKYKNFGHTLFSFLSFLFVATFCLHVGKLFAAGLDVQPPSTSSQGGSATGLPAYVLSLFNLGMSIGIGTVIISLTIGGIMYFLAPISAEARASAKDRVSGSIAGLLILLSTYLIITTINPQLSIFKVASLPAANLPVPGADRAPGVYFYGNEDNSDCSDTSKAPNTESLSDLGPLKNEVHSVEIAGGVNGGSSYVTVLYDKTNFWGKCQYIKTGGCQQVDPFAASASIHAYDNSPNGDGVYFYRESCFNDQEYANISEVVAHCNKTGDGYYEVKNSDINGIYNHNLQDLKFNGVPEEEQNCTKYDEKGKCTGRTPPSLGGENISSIIINGNYLVLLIYKSTQDNGSGPWTSCQEFPIDNDINKSGPRQVKWQNIRNGGGVLPNYVVIIPIK